MSDTIVVRDKIYIPIKHIDEDLAVETYTQHFYQESVCRRCPYKRDRFSEYCANCEIGGYQGKVCFVNKKFVNGVTYFGFPIGDRLNIESRMGLDFDEFDIKDLRVKPKFQYPVKFTGKLRDYQIEIQNQWVKAKHGLVKAPPRSGKTLTSLSICISLGLRFVIVADQKDFLDNFLEEMEAHTNIKELSEKAGKKLYGFLKKDEDYKDFQIGLATYQSFIRDSGDSKRRRKLLYSNFGTVFVDEVHKSSANEFSKFINACPAKYKGGCTATDIRKDGKHIIAERLIGPVVAETQVDTMHPKMTVHVTEAAPKKAGMYRNGPKAWTQANRFISKHPKRNQQIVEGVLKDLALGRSIVMAVYFKDTITTLVKMINDAYGSEVAIGFVGGGGEKNKRERKAIVDAARSGKYRVVIGIRKLMQLGLNVPRWDTLYYINPISNEPNWQQESRRICTPAENKKQPYIRFFVDPEISIMLGCFRNTWKHSLGFGYRPTERAKSVAASLGAYDTKNKPADNDSGMYDSDQRDSYYAKKNQKKQSTPIAQGGLFGGMFSARAK